MSYSNGEAGLGNKKEVINNLVGKKWMGLSTQLQSFWSNFKLNFQFYVMVKKLHFKSGLPIDFQMFQLSRKEKRLAISCFTPQVFKICKAFVVVSIE